MYVPVMYVILSNLETYNPSGVSDLYLKTIGGVFSLTWVTLFKLETYVPCGVNFL